MDMTLNGAEIVAGISGARPWWKLQATDIQPWVATLHPSATQESASRIEWIGDAWDGESDIHVGAEVVTAKQTSDLLARLRRGIRALSLGVAAPTPSSVRQALYGISTRQAFVIDFDFGDFILPIAIDENELAAQPSWAETARKMLAILNAVPARRATIQRRELNMRRAFEETVKRIGHGVGGLWLRMDPFPVREDPKYIQYQAYHWVMITLSRTLDWTPVGAERAHTMKDIRDYFGFFFKAQRLRAEAITTLVATGSKGAISELALAFCEERGLDPRDTLDLARAAARDDSRGALQFVRNEKRETLYYVDGTMHASFEFEGGHYYTDCLTLWGTYPEILAEGAKGRPFEAFVDHLLFKATGVTVARAETRSQAFDLWHDMRPRPIEQVGREHALTALAA